MVTRADSGIDKATAVLLAANMAEVAMLGHCKENNRENRNEILRQGGEVLDVIADLVDEMRMRAAIERAAQAGA
jgi:NAD(P)-dependent dehydrogenase (short-subunit alcohol dehydrogenase family)